MQATRWMGLATVGLALFGGALGCSAGSKAPATYGGAPGSTDYAPVEEAVSTGAPEAPMTQGYAPMAPMPMGEAEAGAAAPSMAPPSPAPPPPPSQPGAARAEAKGGGVARADTKPASRPAPAREPVAPEPVDRPGLATQWGETRVSRITTVPFVRAEPQNPFGLVSLFYNDEEGARTMASAAGFRRLAPQAFTMASGAVAIGLRGEGGAFLSGFVAGEKTFAIGQPGQRYSIVLRNLTPTRIECVVSVDGLDVLDGQPASFAKRGYLLDPHGEVEIDGFRQSMDTVAAFRFGSVRGSYANQKHGDTRNVGIIGVALFHERGTTPWNPAELNRRQNANPFPGQFATPPGQ